MSASSSKSFTCASAMFRTNKISILEITCLSYSMKCFIFDHWSKWLIFLYLALQNPEVVALRGGLSTILKNVIDCQLSRINEALITTVLHLINHPKTRQYVRADVELEVSAVLLVQLQKLNTVLLIKMFYFCLRFCLCWWSVLKDNVSG